LSKSAKLTGDLFVADGLNQGEESRVKSLAEAQEAIKGAIASW
jgi:hypothetical protein